MRPSSIFLLLSSFLSLATATPQATTSAAGAVASPNGLIVPFSTLPACASLCGHLFDVQGACTPPVTSTVSEPCFCGDPRLQPFLDQGTAGVSSVCGPLSCTATADLQAIQSWYETYCNEGQSNPTTTSGAAGATGTSGGSGGAAATAGPVNNSWYVLAAILVVLYFSWGQAPNPPDSLRSRSRPFQLRKDGLRGSGPRRASEASPFL
jgi:hypothetical protein